MKIPWNRGAAHRQVRTVYRNKWFTIKNRDGYYSIEHDAPQVAILPVISGTHLLMVKVKRPLIDDTPLELPAGGSGPEENPAAAARRELLEETGIEVKDLRRFKLLPLLSVLPDRSPELLISYRIDLDWEEFHKRGKPDNEIAEVVSVDFGDLKKMIASGEFYITSVIALVARHIFTTGRQRTRDSNQRSWMNKQGRTRL